MLYLTMPATLSIFEVRLPAENEYTPEAATSFVATLASSFKKNFFEGTLTQHNLILSLEAVLQNGQITFHFTCKTKDAPYLKSQLLGLYPTALLTELKQDYLATNTKPLFYSQVSTSLSHHYPIKQAKDFKDIDPLVSILAPLSRSSSQDDFFIYQVLLSPAGRRWQDNILTTIQNGILIDASKNIYSPHPDRAVFEEKIKQNGVVVQINLASSSAKLLDEVASSFGIYTHPKGNHIKESRPNPLLLSTLKHSLHTRHISRRLKNSIYNSEELSLLWHFPTKLTRLPNISWGKTLYADPPENLPVFDIQNQDQQQSINYFAKTTFKNKDTTFGIKSGIDRRRHMYIIGKSGTGKTTLIANMAIDDIKKGNGVCVVDPHGDLSNTLLNYIPSSRINDVCYFNPADPDYIYPLNVLETHSDSQRELVASGVLSIFKKLYGTSWGPRLEHILRNTLLTLVYTPHTHLGHVVEILTNPTFRKDIVEKLDNQTLKNFWHFEFDKMDDKLRVEAISPILNKVGQFLSSTKIRNTVSQTKSKVRLQEIMDTKKILIANLSSGLLGEDNSALLGAMLITQIQHCAMNRIGTKEEERQDFYLYVDEFQNFATDAFIKILSEARKFRLNLIVANQYMSQLDKTIQDAILGNVGSLLSYVVGSQDAAILSREYGKQFPPEDLVKIGKHQILTKISVNSETSNPFYAQALPPLSSVNQGKDKVIRSSQERWGKRNVDK